MIIVIPVIATQGDAGSVAMRLPAQPPAERRALCGRSVGANWASNFFGLRWRRRCAVRLQFRCRAGDRGRVLVEVPVMLSAVCNHQRHQELVRACRLTASLRIDRGVTHGHDVEIKQVVRERYASAAATSKRCCGRPPGELAQPDLGLDMIGDAYKTVEATSRTPISASAAACRHSTPASSQTTSSLTLVPVPASTPSWPGASWCAESCHRRRYDARDAGAARDNAAKLATKTSSSVR